MDRATQNVVKIYPQLQPPLAHCPALKLYIYDLSHTVSTPLLQPFLSGRDRYRRDRYRRDRYRIPKRSATPRLRVVVIYIAFRGDYGAKDGSG